MAKFFTFKKLGGTTVMVRKADIKAVYFDMSGDREIEIEMVDNNSHIIYCDNLSEWAWWWKKLCYKFKLMF